MSLIDTKFELCHDVERVLEIGRNFQKQDAWRGARHDTVKLLCDTIEHLRDQSNAQIGNAAAMRDALLEIETVAGEAVENGTMELPQYSKIVDIAESALSAPPRNCDRKFVDKVDMYYAFKDWCHAKGHTMEPLLASDAFDWFLETAMEKGAADDK